TSPAPTAFYPLSLHDALPIYPLRRQPWRVAQGGQDLLEGGGVHDEHLLPEQVDVAAHVEDRPGRPGDGHRLDTRHLGDPLGRLRSEEHTSELQSRENLVCRLL